MASFREAAISFIVVGIFIIAIIGFGAQLALDNNTSNSILDNPAINKSFVSINESLEDIRIDADAQKEAWFKDIPIIGDIGLIWKSLTGILRVFFNIIINMYNVIIDLISETIGFPKFVVNTIAAIVTISTLLLLWRVVRSGS